MNTKASKALEEYHAKVRSGEIEKTKRRNPIEKAQENPNSKALAIAAKCHDCIFDSHAGGSWRDQVRNCPCIDCPLWNVRPK